MRAGLLALAVIFAASPALASAREFTPAEIRDFQYEGKPLDYAYVENPDGTFTEYYKQSGGAYLQGDTYSAKEMVEADRLVGEAGVDAGTTSQTGAAVSGADPITEEGARKVIESLRTGKPYFTSGEAGVGDELIGESVAEGTLPDLASVAGAASGTLLVGGSALAVGVAIGTGIDELLGLPTFSEVFGERPSSGEGSGLTRNLEWLTGYESQVRLGSVAHCTVPNYLLLGGSFNVDPGEEWCEFPGAPWNASWKYEHYSFSTEKWEKVEGNCKSTFYDDGANTLGRILGNWRGYTPSGECGEELVPNECPIVPAVWVSCASGLEPEHEDRAVIQLWGGLKDVFKYDAFPDEGLKKSEAGVEVPAPGHLEPLRPVTTPVAVPERAHVPAPLRHYIIEKATEKAGKPIIVPVEKGAELPAPTSPSIPAFRPNELYTEYKTELESAGYTHIEENILTEVTESPATGPNDVASVAPSPGTITPTSTSIRVDVNPSSAPAGAVVPPISGPTPPGFHAPDFGVLCTRFPFGVPCWFVHTFEKWAHTGKAPAFTVNLPDHIEWKVSLAAATPFLETFDPILLACVTIGVVAMFFMYALSGTGSPGGDED